MKEGCMVREKENEEDRKSVRCRRRVRRDGQWRVSPSIIHII